MSDAKTAYIRYVFFDVVGFTKGRTVEAQAEIVDRLNKVTRSALKLHNVRSHQRILIPTGDGICIALLGLDRYDIHLRAGLEIHRFLHFENSKAADNSRKFQIRIGVNENTDNIIKDVNGQRNVAGNGISLAQRVMDFADGGQILASQSVYEVLKGRETYFKAFRRFNAIGKHDEAFPVFQYVLPGEGLNQETPVRFRSATPPKPNLSRETAFFIAHALRHRSAIEQVGLSGSRSYAFVTLFGFLARDSVAQEAAGPYGTGTRKTYGMTSTTFAAQFSYYDSLHFWVLTDLHEAIVGEILEPFEECFEHQDYRTIWALPNEEGKKRLAAEHADIAAKLAGGTSL